MWRRCWVLSLPSGCSSTNDVGFWYVFEPGPILKVAAVILGGLCVSSGLLFVHFRSQESYLTLESIFLLVCFAHAFVNLLWLGPVLFFL